MTDFEQIDIYELLPQCPPFVAVDRLLYCDFKTVQTAFYVKTGSIFCENGILSEAGIVENIAQTCAAQTGYINKYVHRSAIQTGVIGAIRNLDFVRLPRVGETLFTRIETVQEVFRTTLVNATVYIDRELISSCEMKIAIIDSERK
jgi:predicted hotdog family 3-hydroxylacyl-ACP dehydratase